MCGTSFGSPAAERGFPLVYRFRYPRLRQRLSAPRRQSRSRAPPRAPDRWCRSGLVADEPDGAEQVALDHERVEPRDPAIRIDLVEHQGVLDGRARVHAPNLTSPCPLPTPSRTRIALHT